MNGHATPSDDLPELNDDDITILYEICKVANTLAGPPFKVLVAAYEQVFADQGIEREHDSAVFRVIYRLGDAARQAGRHGGQVDLVGCLKSVCAAHGITLVDTAEASGEAEEERRSVVVGQQSPRVNGDGVGSSKRKGDGRRVSFNDARLEETWLSEDTRDLYTSTPAHVGQAGLLAQPPRRGRGMNLGEVRRTRSTSSQRLPDGLLYQSAAPEHHQPGLPSLTHESEAEQPDVNPTLLYQPTQAELEHNAEAFLFTSDSRLARRCLHIWHDRALRLLGANAQAYAIAAAHDRHTLLKQSFDLWRDHCIARQEERRLESYVAWLESKSEDFRNIRDRWLLSKAFSQWRGSLRHQQQVLRTAKNFILRMRYFHKWRALAVEHAAKARGVLLKKYLNIWRLKLVRHRTDEFDAVVHHEGAVMKRCLKAWFFNFCDSRVTMWREQKLQRKYLSVWVQRTRQQQDREVQAGDHYLARIGSVTLHQLRARLTTCREKEACACDYHHRTLTSRGVAELRAQAKLAPIQRIVSLKVQLNLRSKAFGVWHLHFRLAREAFEADRKRILQTAWTKWNDALRCKALAQRIDERVLVESLYKWVLAERLRLFERAVNARIARQVLERWRNRTTALQLTIEEAEQHFFESQQRRRLVCSMTKLHLAMRKREDAERAAVEFANIHSMVPHALEVMAEKVRHVRELNKWAADARFYTLCTRAIAVWHTRTTQQQHNRRRDAYATIRARIKERLVSECLHSLRRRHDEIVAMQQEAEQRAAARAVEVGTQAFDKWRAKTARIIDMEQQATNLDRQRLKFSALAAMRDFYALQTTMKDRAMKFQHQTELSLLAAALRKLQWAQFTAARRVESAEALWTRNRDAHIRHMLRHWHWQALARQAARQTPAPEEAEPESPSLRPASRAASRSRERERSVFASSPPPPTASATPAYLRSPSRSRRAARFRPIPTPAPVTPFAFDPAYLSTTPAPVSGDDVSALTPQVTPFARKLRAGGISGVGVLTPALRTTTAAAAAAAGLFGRSVQGGTAKSVRFAQGSGRFGMGGGSEAGRLKSS
ncbi:Sfi1-domain-containing protein [Teratosphaeria nubilosa]|uniref:Sfi1-domain-containing protein n=1 Tax=Teratosphaeria nubilosa TaxID=161662 RepID=A0A6G1L019_9PEZI|nr:Sfi1-domain-containing protein [Teratosphaeria nubilosa]